MIIGWNGRGCEGGRNRSGGEEREWGDEGAREAGGENYASIGYETLICRRITPTLTYFFLLFGNHFKIVQF